MFLHVSVCPRGGVPGQVHPTGQVQPPWAGTPLGRYTPRQVHPPGQVHPPPGAGTPPEQVQPQAGTPPPGSACWYTVNKRAVRIPLECILVLNQQLLYPTWSPFHGTTL